MPPVLEAYTNEIVVYGRGFPSEENKPTITGGKATNFSSNQTLPWGLSLDEKTGIISGTPTYVHATRDYRITVSGPGGSTSRTISIGVEERLPEYLDPPYGSSDPLVVTEGIRMINTYPNLLGYSNDYKLSNPLPQGLAFQSTT
ncbi:MAG: Ig domain-containing protein, partial [Opitutae bacterium]